MALKLGVETALASANAVATVIDGGTAASTLVVYDGTEPADPSVAIDTQVALVTFELADPAFAVAVDDPIGGLIVANPVTPVEAAAAGTATWFRIFDGDGVALLQGSVSEAAGTGDVKISSTSIVSGVEVSVLYLNYYQPKA